MKQPSCAIVMIFIVKNTPPPCCAQHATTRPLMVSLEQQAESAFHGHILCLHGRVLFRASRSSHNISGQSRTILLPPLTLEPQAETHLTVLSYPILSHAANYVWNYLLFSNCRKKLIFLSKKIILFDNSIIFYIFLKYRKIIELSVTSYIFDKLRK